MVRLAEGLHTFRWPLLAQSGARPSDRLDPTILKMAIPSKSARRAVFEWLKSGFVWIFAS